MTACFTLDWSRHATGKLAVCHDAIGSGPDKPICYCAIGAYLRSVGVSDETMLENEQHSVALFDGDQAGYLSAVPAPARWVFAEVDEELWSVWSGVDFSELALEIAAVNDDLEMDRESKEIALRMLFRRADVDIRFTGSQP